MSTPKTRTLDAGTGKLNLSSTFGYDTVGNLSHRRRSAHRRQRHP